MVADFIFSPVDYHYLKPASNLSKVSRVQVGFEVHIRASELLLSEVRQPVLS
jgi:hypothetical protein